MAWWDHEELKSMELRSDRYIVMFCEEYLDTAHDRAILRGAIDRVVQLDPTEYLQRVKYALHAAKQLGYKPKVPLSLLQSKL